MPNTDVLNDLSANNTYNKLIEDTSGVLADSRQMKIDFDTTYSSLIKFISDLKTLDAELNPSATATTQQ